MQGRNITHIIRRFATNLLFAMVACVLAVSCDVHEFPDDDATVPMHLHLQFHTDMTQSEYINNTQQYGYPSRKASVNARMRYVIRFYDSDNDARASVSSKFREYVFERNVEGDYDSDFVLDVVPGNYTIMAWADFVESTENDGYFYDVSDFSDITKLKPHIGNTDLVDAFRGSAAISEMQILSNKAPVVEMERPLAKYEFISNDLREFLEQESQAATKAESENGSETPDDTNHEPTRGGIDINDYKVMFYYSGYMPNVYNMFTDKPVDSATGIAFEGKLSKLTEDEISLGFDYVIVNHMETSITLRVAILNSAGQQVSLTNPINVPIKRSNHTVVKGRFLMEKASGNVGIDPDYDGDYNIIIK